MAINGSLRIKAASRLPRHDVTLNGCVSGKTRATHAPPEVRFNMRPAY